MDFPRRIADTPTLQQVSDAFDEMEVDGSIDLESMKASVETALKGKGKGKKHVLSPKTAASSAPPKRVTRAHGKRAVPQPKGKAVSLRPQTPEVEAVGSPALASVYPREVPEADTVSQRAIEEISVTSTQLRQQLDEEREHREKLESELAKLKRSHNALATDHETVKSLVLTLVKAKDGEKRGTTSIQSARDVLAQIHGAGNTAPSTSSSQMLPPPRPQRGSGQAMAPGGRPSHKPV
jgi:FtsZ-binding cell division protein ZapB